MTKVALSYSLIFIFIVFIGKSGADIKIKIEMSQAVDNIELSQEKNVTVCFSSNKYELIIFKTSSLQVKNKKIFREIKLNKPSPANLNINIPRTIQEDLTTLSKAKSINILTTSFPLDMMDEIEKFCKIFKAKQYKVFSDHITHMVFYPAEESGNKIETKRTVKYLMGVINGIWIVSYKCMHQDYYYII